MKKIWAVVILFLISFLFVGCNNYVDTYYFSFVRDNLSCEVGDTIKICELESNTNIKTYEHMHIYTNDSKVAQVNNSDFSVKLLKEGSVTIFISGKYSNDYLTDSIVLNISSSNDGLGDNNGDDSLNNEGNDNGSQDSSGQDENIYKLTSQIINESFILDKKVISYNIMANNQNYTNFNYEIISSDDEDISVYMYSSMIEIIYKTGSHAEIKIFDNTNANNCLVLNLS